MGMLKLFLALGLCVGIGVTQAEAQHVQVDLPQFVSGYPTQAQAVNGSGQVGRHWHRRQRLVSGILVDEEGWTDRSWDPWRVLQQCDGTERRRSGRWPEHPSR
jgi:hypothetical protein